MAWIVLNCTAGSEFTVRDRLVNDLGFEIFVPVYRKQIRPRRVRKLRTLMLALLPRYIFLNSVDIARERERLRQRCPHTCWPLRHNGYGFLTVPDADIISLKTREASHEFDNLMPGVTVTIKVGTLVWRISGPLQGHKGLSWPS